MQPGARLRMALVSGQAEDLQWGKPWPGLAFCRAPGGACIGPDLLYGRLALPLIGPGLGLCMAWHGAYGACVRSR